MDEAKIEFARGFTTEPDDDKFNTCKHRSEKMQTYTMRTCCQPEQQTGFVCFKLQINGVTPNHCFGCNAYEVKEGTKENGEEIK